MTTENAMRAAIRTGLYTRARTLIESGKRTVSETMLVEDEGSDFPHLVDTTEVEVPIEDSDLAAKIKDAEEAEKKANDDYLESHSDSDNATYKKKSAELKALRDRAKKNKKKVEKWTATSSNEFLSYLKMKGTPFSDVKEMLKDANAAYNHAQTQSKKMAGKEKWEFLNHQQKVKGFANKIDALKKYLGSHAEKMNKDVEKHNEKQDNKRKQINNVADMLSDGNPLIKTVVGLIAAKMIRDKEKVNTKNAEDEDNLGGGDESDTGGYEGGGYEGDEEE